VTVWLAGLHGSPLSHLQQAVLQIEYLAFLGLADGHCETLKGKLDDHLAQMQHLQSCHTSSNNAKS